MTESERETLANGLNKNTKITVGAAVAIGTVLFAGYQQFQASLTSLRLEQVRAQADIVKEVGTQIDRLSAETDRKLAAHGARPHEGVPTSAEVDAISRRLEAIAERLRKVEAGR